jgi:putative NADPH-quinone reductase
MWDEWSLCTEDDYENELKGLLKETDVIVFAFPVYYFGWPAQIKAVVDRFYSHTMELTNMHKKSVMLTLAWNDDEETFAVTKAYYDKICDYMQFENLGLLLKRLWNPSMTAGTDYPKMAYELGLSI